MGGGGWLVIAPAKLAYIFFCHNSLYILCAKLWSLFFCLFTVEKGVNEHLTKMNAKVNETLNASLTQLLDFLTKTRGLTRLTSVLPQCYKTHPYIPESSTPSKLLMKLCLHYLKLLQAPLLLVLSIHWLLIWHQVNTWKLCLSPPLLFRCRLSVLAEWGEAWTSHAMPVST